MDTTTDLVTPFSDTTGAVTCLPYMLYDDPVFEDILMKERPLTLIYICAWTVSPMALGRFR